MDNCTFCKIVKGEIPSFKVWEDDEHLALLTIQPIKDGHTLVIPKAHTPYIFEMENQSLAKLAQATKPVAKILKDKFQPKSGKVSALVMGLGVDHVHVHLFPLDDEKDIKRPAKMVSTKKLKEIHDKIIN